MNRAIAVEPDDVETRVTRELVALDWKAGLVRASWRRRQK